MERYVTQDLGWNHFTNLIGLRADEPRRVAKIAQSGRAAFDREAPLAQAGIDIKTVSTFWNGNDFDLHLANVNGKAMKGNCDLCFLKGAWQILSLIRETPTMAIWWMRQEARIHSAGQINGNAGLFRSDRPSYASMYRMATQHGELFPFDDEPLQDCMCTD